MNRQWEIMAQIVDTYRVGDCVEKRREKHGRYPMSDKLRAITMSESGMGSIAIGREMGIDSSVIRVWVRKYRTYGMDGLKPASYRKNAPLKSSGNEEGHDGEPKDSRYGFIRYVDNPALMRSMTGCLTSYGIRHENIEVWDNFSDYLKTVESGGTIVVNSLFDISTDVSSLITTINTLFNSNITVISLEDNGAVIMPDKAESGTLLRVLNNYVKVACTDTAPSVKRAASCNMDELVNEPAIETDSVDGRFADAYEIWCNGGSMAYAARVCGCPYSSFRYWIKKNHKSRAARATFPVMNNNDSI